MTEVLAVVGGYLLGSLPFGYWLPLLFRGDDIRAQGSGNVGATNVFRVYGRRLGAAVVLLDVGKGFAAALLGLWAGGALVGVLAGQHVGDVGNLLPNGLWIDAVGEVVGHLLRSAAIGLIDSGGHRVGDGVRVHMDLA